MLTTALLLSNPTPRCQVALLLGITEKVVKLIWAKGYDPDQVRRPTGYTQQERDRKLARETDGWEDAEERDRQ